MNGSDLDRWSEVAAEWAALWGEFARPVWQVMVDTTGIGPQSRVLDVGCGSGEFLAFLARLGATTAGIDPAPGMLALARSRVAGADIRLGSADHLSWPANEFDVATAINAVQFADDTINAVAEMTRVTGSGDFVAIANWAEDERNDLDVIEAAVANAAGEEVLPGGALRQPGGLEKLFADTGLDVVTAGLVEVPWTAPDDATLVRGVLLGEDTATMAELATTVISAARPFRVPDGSYRLVNAFRYAVGRTPTRTRTRPPTPQAFAE